LGNTHFNKKHFYKKLIAIKKRNNKVLIFPKVPKAFFFPGNKVLGISQLTAT